MNQNIDIRDRAFLSGDEVSKLNFIKDSKDIVFRKYYRSGLRSHIFEILAASDIKKETQGEIIDGVKLFPRAEPVKILRILRNRFENKDQVFKEIEKYELLLRFLGTDLIALSNEFMVAYIRAGKSQIVLCGLQDYVKGRILDPWQLPSKGHLQDLLKSMGNKDSFLPAMVEKAKRNIFRFIKNNRHMINETGYIPDLAGIGNLILTPKGDLKLVDINNIVKILLDDKVRVDDKGYPSCDVSVEVLSILERKILKKNIDMNDPLYQLFLSSERKKEVKSLERKFYASL